MKKLSSILMAGLMTGTLIGCGAETADNSAADTTVAEDTASESTVEATAEATTASTEASSEGAASGEAMYDGTTILGQSSWVGYAPLYLADKMGFFDNYGADVEVEYFESKTDSKSALAAGRIQGMSTTVDTHVMSSAVGMDIKIILALDDSCGGDGVSAKSEITDIPSLKGHTVALDTSGGASYFWFQYILKEYDMTLDDVQVVNMSSGDAGAAFVAGEVDAAVTWEPWLSRASETSDGSILIDSSETPGVIVDALAVDSEFAEKYPGTCKAITQAWYDALDYIETNPDEAYKIMMEYTGDETVEALQGSMAEVQFYDKEKNIEYFGGEISEIATMASDLWLEMDLIESQPDIEALIDDEFLAGVE